MASSGTVRRRHVFYVSGFDPNGPSRYHRLYAAGAQQQSEWGAATIDVGPRKRVPGEPQTMAWQVRWRLKPPGDGAAAAQKAATDATPDATPEATVETDYAFPRWDAIIRAYWWPGRWKQARDLLATSWMYLTSGAFRTIYGQGWTPFITLFAPFLLLVLMLPGVLALVAAKAAVLMAWRSRSPVAGPLALAGVVAVAGLVWAYWARRYRHTQWLMRGYAFVGRMARRTVPEMDTRLDEMAAALCRRVRQNRDDEVLVVGHSLGTVMAVSVLARALRMDPLLARRGPALSLLTLGHCLPVLTNLPMAQPFRDELAALVGCDGLCWVDFCDPLDDYSFPGVDPVRAAGLRAPRADHPQLRSPDFAAMMAPGPRRLPRMNVHDIHQQYLGPSPQPQNYDFFAMTAGPLTLAARFGATADAAGPAAPAA
ncbi:hypothetical protein GN316_17360 [Xylophilus sp. Kf1]|nr:hypothetical protein [Xylophilus sp. Kf1]